MKRKRFSKEQLIGILKQAEAGTPVKDLICTHGVAEARMIIERWRIDYNQRRPHSALGYRTPEEFTRQLAGAHPLGGADSGGGTAPTVPTTTEALPLDSPEKSSTTMGGRSLYAFDIFQKSAFPDHLSIEAMMLW